MRGSGRDLARRRWGRVAVLTIPMLGACTVGPDFTPEKPWWQPSSWSSTKPTAPVERASLVDNKPIDPKWWDQFQDPELSRLEQRVASENLDMRIADMRLGESRSQLGITQANQYPILNADGSYSHQYLSPNGVIGLFPPAGATSSGGGFGGIAPGTTGTSFGSLGSSAGGTAGTLGAIPVQGTTIPPFNLYQYGFDAAWEIDFWGQVRRQVEAAKAMVQATEDQRRDALVSIEAELARDYINLRGTQRTLAITEENLASANQSLDLTRQRASGGLTTDLDVANAEAQADNIAAQLPPLRQQEAELINAISELLGREPGALKAELAEAKPIPPVPPSVPMGLPSELARRRPDIRAAEASLHAATAQIGVAVADFFPNVSLTGSFGIAALNASQLGSLRSEQYGVGPTVSLPIFRGGQLVSTLALRKQQQKEAALTYQKTVLQALHDVDNALTAYNTEQKREEELTKTVTAARRALDLARQRYVQGVATFLDVLTAQSVLLGAELQLAQSTTLVSTNLVLLYKALGGGWEQSYPLPPEQQTAEKAHQPSL
ncbi:MAG: efflux transporter outer membrane subunit [Acidibrevibacterium sp.]|jgi:NodT family efflux transporter outer membrane factor (OMF) lipoprotein|uniref:efflux transporter outer membrane subunit n=2 Tax=Acetobacterales TaxID=3120395 RepID=UPI000E0DA6F9|nr:efflux transporter outer membrane subunit [Acidibrevibacterium fodinaquatile]MCA7118618.1 efflux transporter outer membrane subunit [Acidibrevibacterium fodinaquatile]